MPLPIYNSKISSLHNSLMIGKYLDCVPYTILFIFLTPFACLSLVGFGSTLKYVIINGICLSKGKSNCHFSNLSYGSKRLLFVIQYFLPLSLNMVSSFLNCVAFVSKHISKNPSEASSQSSKRLTILLLP